MHQVASKFSATFSAAPTSPSSLPSKTHAVQSPFAERALVAIWSRRVNAVGRGRNGEQHEQGKSRQSAPQQGRRNQRQTRKHAHPHVAQGLRTEFRSGLSRHREAERGST